HAGLCGMDLGERAEPGGGGGARGTPCRRRSGLIRINLLTEARTAAARKKGPFLPSGARLNNLILLGGVVLGLLYIGIMALTLTHRSRDLDEEIARANEEVARLRSIIDEVKGYEDKKEIGRASCRERGEVE